MSTRKTRSFGLVALGAVAGVLTSIGISAVAERSGTPLPLDELRQFTSVFGAIKNNYVEPVTDTNLINGAISGMLSSLDPHSAYLDAEAFEDMQTATQGEFGGLGIEVGAEDGFVKVISPIEDTPAARGGVLAGDLIIKIDDTPTKGMTLTDAVKLMRGAPKTPIRLTIVRDGVDQPIVIDIVRDVIKVRSVRSKMLDDGYGYVRVSQFQERTGADLVQHLRELGRNGVPKGVVLDLRNDPGGLLTGAIGVSAAFLPPDVLVVSTDGRAPESRHRYLANPVDFARGESNYMRDLPEWAKTVPLVVLVNAGSASASEIVAGALQDHGRAKVMGNRTFGKGSVQVILPLSENTGIKLTTSRYYTPNGSSIQAKGIEPDIVVSDTEKGDLFRLPREADLQRHLSNKQTPEEEVRSNEIDKEQLKDFKMFEFGGDDDFQLRQAINLLQGRPVETGGPGGTTVVEAAPAARQRITVDGVESSKK
ncbi:S41 family peptidase [Kerstersia gyiorum]|uniref:Peptidase S41 n=1 Tax=Kerstersia gyiorum TaxID=206506 RepID=A0A171KRZ3_9BURK|nr:S41 family peptidase [Kerstersia gyiorum]KKO71660.1 peptidase S41 [Kerstersia gyiorum]MCP1634373.1 carboxyl-terminal processing protease [Kerstersia gyiorum]MCP1638000.1 carboxyl-terminal processing protease [Kerstersia gyiorum]MCP1672435.1 carboxyl-terminal processing protease [Kerstersia gyiorum]MCP1680176.1 carboxyl-terminal processing protease [Kerstersia gyiorum]